MSTNKDDEIEQLREEVLRWQIHFLEGEKEDLRRQYVFICQELERTRAKLPSRRSVRRSA